LPDKDQILNINNPDPVEIRFLFAGFQSDDPSFSLQLEVRREWLVEEDGRRKVESGGRRRIAHVYCLLDTYLVACNYSFLLFDRIS
jgi:hypothetical protein